MLVIPDLYTGTPRILSAQLTKRGAIYLFKTKRILPFVLQYIINSEGQKENSVLHAGAFSILYCSTKRRTQDKSENVPSVR